VRLAPEDILTRLSRILEVDFDTLDRELAKDKVAEIESNRSA